MQVALYMHRGKYVKRALSDEVCPQEYISVDYLELDISSILIFPSNYLKTYIHQQMQCCRK
jgi:hypothetical protein